MAREKTEFIIQVNPELCKSCELCVEFCGKDALRMTKELKGSNSVPEVILENCNGCGLCELYCPDFAIYIVKKVAAKAI